jgi:hypothetical protein
MRNIDLSEGADVGAADISKFEANMRVNLGEDGISRIRKVLEKHGVVFYADGSVGVRAK